MRYLYHYHAIYHPHIGTIAHADGTCERPEPITSAEDYQSLKDGVAKECGVTREQLTICSLTLLSSQNILLASPKL